MGVNIQSKVDIVIVGGGIAGSVAAWVLRDQGLSVALVDDHSTASPIFKAERISLTTAKILKDVGLYDRLERIALPLHTTASIKSGRVEAISENTDYSIPLWKLVAELRSGMQDAGIDIITDRAESAETTDSIQNVQLRSGGTLQCKLLVVATGAAMTLLRSLGIEREMLSKNHSSTFGFDIECGSDFALPGDSVSIRICKDGADYMNVFPTPEGTFRANLFTYWPGGGEQVRSFAKGDVNATLNHLAPHMKRVTGDWTAVGKVQCGSVDIIKSTGFRKAGFALIGDAYGRICPCFGMGVNKALSDVLALRRHLPKWFELDLPLTPETLSQYYDDPARSDLEEHLFRYSLFIRNRLLSKQPIWQLRRFYYDRVPVRAKELVRSLRQNDAPATWSLAN